MPYLSEKIKLPKNLDRRIKLTDKQKSEIRKLFKSTTKNRNELARMFGVNKGTIRAVIFPGWYQSKLKKRSDNQDWKKYYKREKNTVAIRNTRRYKQELYVKGVIG